MVNARITRVLCWIAATAAVTMSVQGTGYGIWYLLAAVLGVTVALRPSEISTTRQFVSAGSSNTLIVVATVIAILAPVWATSAEPGGAILIAVLALLAPLFLPLVRPRRATDWIAPVAVAALIGVKVLALDGHSVTDALDLFVGAVSVTFWYGIAAAAVFAVAYRVGTARRRTRNR